MDELPAKMTSMVEHQSARGCFREKGREPGGDHNVMLDLHDEDDKLVMVAMVEMLIIIIITMVAMVEMVEMMLIPLARSSLTARQQRAAWARSK